MAEKRIAPLTTTVTFPDGAEDPLLKKIRRQLTPLGARFWGPPRELPKRMQRGALQQCYRNASRHLIGHPEMRYVEGFSQTQGRDLAGLGQILEHAWLVDATGQVIETTWAQHGRWYFGVAFTEEEWRQARALVRPTATRPKCDCLLCWESLPKLQDAGFFHDLVADLIDDQDVLNDNVRR